LLYHSLQLATELQRRLDKQCKVVLGMRYGNPSIQQALSQLEGCDKITVLPLYPQYSSAATGSSIEKVLEILSSQPVIPSINIIGHFFAHPGFIQAQAQVITPFLSKHDYILFSYHGLPEKHLMIEGCNMICANECPSTNNLPRHCYRLQCFQTTASIAKVLALTHQQYGTSFQSRLGKTPWIKPYTNEVLRELNAKGIKRLAIVCPSFVSDCLETLEEIGEQAQEQWLSMGGEQLSLIPSLNDNKLWIDSILSMTDLNSFSSS
jgi:ferrochelatase